MTSSSRYAFALLALSTVTACSGSVDEDATASNSAAFSVSDLAPQVESFDPLRIRLPGDQLRPVLSQEILAALQSNNIDERERKVHFDEVNVDLGNGEISVKAKGEGRLRKCVKVLGRYQCTPWISSTVRAEVRVGLGVRDWVVEAEHRYTDISASNDAVDALIRTFHDRVYPKVNDGIKKALSSVDGRNLRTELEGKLGLAIAPNATLDIRVLPDGIVLDTHN